MKEPKWASTLHENKILELILKSKRQITETETEIIVDPTQKAKKTIKINQIMTIFDLLLPRMVTKTEKQLCAYHFLVYSSYYST